MFKWRRQQVEPVGLDIGVEGVRLLQVRADASPGAVAMHWRALPQAGGADAARQARSMPQPWLRLAAVTARRMLAEAPFTGRRVITCLPSPLVHVKTVRVALCGPGELESAARREAAALFPFDLAQARLQILGASQVHPPHGSPREPRQDVIMAAVRKQDIDVFLAELHRAGLTVESLDIEPCALHRCMAAPSPDPGAPNFLIHIGAYHTQVLLGQGGSIRFARVFEIGAGHLREAVARKLGIAHEEAHRVRQQFCSALPEGVARLPSDAVRKAVFDASRGVLEALGNEVSRCLRYDAVTFRGERPMQVCIAGADAHDMQVRAALAAATGLPIVSFDPLHPLRSIMSRMSSDQTHSAEWTLAACLATQKLAHFSPSLPGMASLLSERAAA